MTRRTRLIAFCLLAMAAAACIVATVGDSRAVQERRANALQTRLARAGQLADLLGPALLDTSESSEETYRTLRRLVDNDPACRSIYSLSDPLGDASLVYEVRSDGGQVRRKGTRLILRGNGIEAVNSAQVRTSVTNRGGQTIVTTHAPIIAKGKVRGLLVIEVNLDRDESFSAVSSSNKKTVLALIAMVACLIAFLALHFRLGEPRPVTRLQQRVMNATEHLSPRLVDSSDDMMIALSRVIDDAQADRGRYEERLRRLSEQQEAISRVKDELIANTVHELRTPLTSIVASVEIVQQHSEMMSDEERREFLDQAAVASRHMMFVVNDMLDAAAIEAGKIAMDIESCDVESILDDARRSMNMVAQSREIDLVVEETESSQRVNADRARALQVILNLVSNAVKYSPMGSKVTLTTQEFENSIAIEIEDEGLGIPEEMKSRLFTRFSQLERESDNPYVQSSGIGLYLSKTLVELMGGSIGHRDSATGGSVFWFTLPQCNESRRSETAARSAIET